jgi:hypothetical protein
MRRGNEGDYTEMEEMPWIRTTREMKVQSRSFTWFTMRSWRGLPSQR